MRVVRPSYWKEFRCIAAECGDNCCIGWEIDIDSESGRFYRSVEGRFGERLNREILLTKMEKLIFVCMESGARF